MSEIRTLVIGEKTFTSVVPSFAKCEELKKKHKVDLLLGMTQEQVENYDFSKAPELMADMLIEIDGKTKVSKKELTDEQRKELVKYFYENAGLIEFTEALRFFRRLSKKA
jgi:ABC-type uncharacterized transport system ATPase subunit